LTAPLSFIHAFERGSDPAAAPVLLLHGTGGDENDLLPLGRAIAPRSALLSPRAKVLENGMPRFFRRLREGVFDEDDVRLRAGELADFVAEAQRAYQMSAPVAVGFSNGANIAAALLLLRPQALRAAILIRAMTPLQDPPPADLRGKRVLILSGAMDPIAPVDNAARLARTLRDAGADVEHETVPASHGLTGEDLRLSVAFFDQLHSQKSV